MATSKLTIKKPIADGSKSSDNSLKVKVSTKEPEKKEPENKTEETPIVVDDKLKGNWNKYLDWLDKKQMRGKKDLDTNDLGNKLFRQYLKENPESGLSEKHIPSIRNAYIELRNDRLKEIQSGKASTNVKPEKFMEHILLNELSDKPNYVGQHLTQTRFPGGKVTNELTGQVRETELLGKGGTKMMK